MKTILNVKNGNKRIKMVTFDGVKKILVFHMIDNGILYSFGNKHFIVKKFDNFDTMEFEDFKFSNFANGKCIYKVSFYITNCDWVINKILNNLKIQMNIDKEIMIGLKKEELLFLQIRKQWLNIAKIMLTDKNVLKEKRKYCGL